MPLKGSVYQVHLLAKILTFALLSMSLDLMWGYTGILSFGHSSFFALGAYSLSLVLKYSGIEAFTYFGLLLAIIVPIIIAAIIGYFIFYSKVSGVYFGIITLATTFIFQQLFVTLRPITGGDNGLYGFITPAFALPGGLSLSFGNRNFHYYLVLFSFILIYVLAKKLTKTPFGQALQGIKDNENRMLFCGYSVPFIKTIIFAIASGIAGFAGALYVPVGFIHPSLFGLVFSTQILVWVAVGGRGTLIGAVVGAFLITYLESFLSKQFASYWLLMIGVFLIAVVMFWPQGIMGNIKEKYGNTFLG